MNMIENKYQVCERTVVDGKTVMVPVTDCMVLTPDTPYVTTALMALARCWAGLDANVAADIRQTIVDWAPPVEAIAGL
jgi:hypothetical protein